jgi:protein involved in polysaccharide export with SLBB domain
MKAGIVVLLAALAWSYSQAVDDARVFVIGAVNQPGAFRYEQGLRVGDTIDRAGGFRHPCMTNRLTIVRMQDGRKVRLAASDGKVLEPGDTLDVMEVNDGENRCK